MTDFLSNKGQNSFDQVGSAMLCWVAMLPDTQYQAQAVLEAARRLASRLLRIRLIRLQAADGVAKLLPIDKFVCL